MKNFYDRLMFAARHYGVKRAIHVAKRIGRSSAAIAQWKDNPLVDHKATTISAIMKAFPCNTDWLINGTGDPGLIAHELHEPNSDYSANTVIQPAKVPLISWEMAANVQEKSAPASMSHHKKWVPVYSTKSVDSAAFALEVEGNSMQNAGSISFEPGDFLICDPGSKAETGDFVIATDDSTQQATFKKLDYDAGRWYLVPLNKQYKAKAIDKKKLKIIAKVIQRVSIKNF